MGVKLTERDISILRTIARVGVLSTSQIKKLYGDKNRYYRRRLEQFEESGYVVREYGFSQITKKGMEIVGLDGTPKRLRKLDIKKRLKVYDLNSMFSGCDMQLGYEVKTEKGINRNAYLNAAIKSQGKTYALYLIDVKEPRPVTVGRMWHELQELPLKGLSHAIILCQYPKAMRILEGIVKKPRMEEILLLPYPSGIELFNVVQSDYLTRLLHEKLPGLKPLSSVRKFADYQWQGNYVTILATNDAVKRFYLQEYYDGMSYQIENKEVVIVCSNEQRTFFSNLYPLAKIVALNISVLRRNGE